VEMSDFVFLSQLENHERTFREHGLVYSDWESSRVLGDKALRCSLQLLDDKC
jgi:hypothetical protein